MALGALLLSAAYPAAGAEPAGLIPNQPAIWCRFDGNAHNDGHAKGEWSLLNTAFQENALYLNGKYRSSVDEASDGFRAVCAMDKFAKDRFTVALRFKRDRAGGEGRNVLMGGTAYRWFGIQVGLSGGLELIFNNGRVTLALEGVELRADGWNWLACSVNIPAQKCVAFLNGKSAEPVALPPDFVLNVRPPVENYDNSWTFTNYSNSRTFCGWVDEFLFYNRELNAAELHGLAHRREMLEPNVPAMTAPPPTVGQTSLSGNSPATRPPPLSSADLAERPGTLAISSVGTVYALAARFAGQYSWNGARVKVQIKQGEIIRQAKGNNPERMVPGFQLFLRRENPQLKHMDIVARSQIVPVNAAITHGQTALVEDVNVEIPVRNIPVAELGKMWLGVWISDALPPLEPAAGAPAGPVQSREGVCLAEAATCLDGSARPAPVAAVKK